MLLDILYKSVFGVKEFMGLPVVLPVGVEFIVSGIVDLLAFLTVADAEQASQPVVLLGFNACGGGFVLLDDARDLFYVVFDIVFGMILVVVNKSAGVVVAYDAVVADAEVDHTDGALLAEANTVAETVTGKGDAVGSAVVEDREEGGTQLEVVTDASEGDAADAFLAGGLAKREQFVADAIVRGVDFVF